MSNPEPTFSVPLSMRDIAMLLQAIEYELANNKTLTEEYRNSLDYLGQHLDRSGEEV
jgi:hypothetical protein